MAYVWDSKTSQWWWFSDEYLAMVDEEEVDSAEPYLLFYEKLT